MQAKTGKKKTDAQIKVDEIIGTWVTKGLTPGCSLAVDHNCEIIYEQGYGLADLSSKTPNTPKTVFHAASLAKQFTAMSILRLIEQYREKFPSDLDTPVRNFVQELDGLEDARKTPDQKKTPAPITIRQLLHHTSGIRDQWVLLALAGWRLSEQLIELEDVLDIVRRMTTLNFEPGTAFSYSNTNYTLASRIFESPIFEELFRQKQTLSTFAQKEIFEKLGMGSTYFVDKHDCIRGPNIAYAYQRKPDGSFEMRMPNFDLTGPTNLLTTVEDLIKWGRILNSPHGEWADPVGKMLRTEAESDGKESKFDGYGLGVMLSKELSKDGKERRIVEHNGRDGGYRSHLICYPDQKLVIALLCNAPPSSYISTFLLVRELAEIYLEGGHDRFKAKRQQEGQEEDPEELVGPEEWGGTYRSAELDICYQVVPSEKDKDSFLLKRRGYPDMPLKEAGHTRIKIKDFSGDVLKQVSVQFIKVKKTGQIYLSVEDTEDGRLTNFRFERQMPQPPDERA
jgi:CubicO group peptidase (beta-lactamase class C family)